MKKIETVRFDKVATTHPEDLANGIVAFEMVKFVINFFGSVIETTHDTRIMADGSQFVIDGCGFIPAGYQVN